MSTDGRATLFGMLDALRDACTVGAPEGLNPVEALNWLVAEVTRLRGERAADAARIYALRAHLEFAITNLREMSDDTPAAYLQDCLDRDDANGRTR